MTLSHFFAKGEIKNHEGNVEYDDEAIFAFSPKTKLQHEQLDKLIRDSIKAQDVTEKAMTEKEKAEEASIPEAVRIKVAEILARPMAKIGKMKQEIPELAKEVLQLKKDYNRLESEVNTVSSDIRNSEREFKEMNDDLDVMIYQNSVIKHLFEVGDSIKLYNSTVTPDRRIVIVDPNDFGTSVDEQSEEVDSNEADIDGLKEATDDE